MTARRVGCGALCLMLVSACAEPRTVSVGFPNPITNPTPAAVKAYRAAWESQHLTTYAYTLEFLGGNANDNGRPIRVAVRQDTVRTAVLLDTGDTLPASVMPTIDALFDMALSAAQRDSLTRIAFDSYYAYPTSFSLLTLPDFASIFQASALQPVP